MDKFVAKGAEVLVNKNVSAYNEFLIDFNEASAPVGKLLHYLP